MTETHTSSGSSTSWASRVLPVLGWAPNYDLKVALRPDLVAGLTIAAFSVPESMAYAGLAGLPPQYGLYGSLVALLVYVIFGTSGQLSVGVTSSLSIMVAGSLGAMALASPEEYLGAAQMTAIVAGLIALVAAILHLDFIVSFISESVLIGFSAGAALFIASSQIGKVFGIHGAEGNFFERISYILRHLGETSGWTLAVGLTSIALLLALDRFVPKLPGALAVVLLAIVVMNVTSLEEKGVEVAGNIPGGLPGIGIDAFPSGHLSAIIGLAFGCFLLSYIEGISVARTFATRKHVTVDPRKELVANGALNIGAGVFQGYPVGGSMSRSAVSDEAGARTPLAGGIAGMMLLLVVLFLTGVFEMLPEATLGAVVLFAVRHLIKIDAFKRLWAVSRPEFIAAFSAAFGVLIFDMLYGILIGAAVSMLLLIARTSRPRTQELGWVASLGGYADLASHDEAVRDARTLIYRVDGDLYFANAQSVLDQLRALISGREEKPSLVIFSLERSPRIDLAAVDGLHELDESLERDGIDLEIADASPEVREMLLADALQRGDESPEFRTLGQIQEATG